MEYTEFKMEQDLKKKAKKGGLSIGGASNKLIGLPENLTRIDGGAIIGGKAKKIYKFKCGDQMVDVRIHGDTIYRVRPSHAPNKWAEFVAKETKGKNGKINLKELAQKYKGGMEDDYEEDVEAGEGPDTGSEYGEGYKRKRASDKPKKALTSWTKFVQDNYHRVKDLPNKERLKKLSMLYRK